MSYQVIWDEKTRNFLRKIHPTEANRIVKKVNSIVDDPHHYLETLVGIKSQKLRVGDYRVVIDIDDNEKKLFVVLIGHRKNIYQYI